VTFSSALFLLVFALIRGNEEGWRSPLIVTLLVASALLLALFIAVERRQPRPMFDLSLLRNRTFAGGSIAAFALSASMFAMFLYLTLYLQTILDYGPLETGLRFLPVTLLSFVAAAVSGKLTARLPARALLGGGLVLVGIGLLLMRGLDAASDWTALLPGFLVAGVGIGPINPSIANAAIGVVAAGHQLDVSAGRHGDRDRRPRRDLPEPGHPPPDERAGRHPRRRTRRRPRPCRQRRRGAPQAVAAAPAAARPRLEHAIHAAFTAALNDILLVAAAVAIVGGLLAVALVRSSDFVAQGAPQAEPAPARRRRLPNGITERQGAPDARQKPALCHFVRL